MTMDTAKAEKMVEFRQLEIYARDLKRVYQSEKQKKRELQTVNRDLTRLTEELKAAISSGSAVTPSW